MASLVALEPPFGVAGWLMARAVESTIDCKTVACDVGDDALLMMVMRILDIFAHTYYYGASRRLVQ